MADEKPIQHIPAGGKPGEVFHAPGAVIQLPNGKKYRLGEKGWELIDEKDDEKDTVPAA